MSKCACSADTTGSTGVRNGGSAQAERRTVHSAWLTAPLSPAIAHQSAEDSAERVRRPRVKDTTRFKHKSCLKEDTSRASCWSRPEPTCVDRWADSSVRRLSHAKAMPKQVSA